MKWSSSWFLLLLLFLQPGAADEVRESNLKHLKSKGFRVASSLPASASDAITVQPRSSASSSARAIVSATELGTSTGARSG